MGKLKMSNELYINDLAPGAGTFKYYNYFVLGIKVKTKKEVYEAITLKISKIIRKDKITKELAMFDYENLSFNEVK